MAVGKEVAEALRNGFDELDGSLLDSLRPVLPSGEYYACLFEFEPTLVWPSDEHDYFAHEHADLFGFDSQWGLPHYPKTPYYRAGARGLSEDEGLFEFLVPLVPPRLLEAARVAEYAGSENLGTALAIAVLDVKTPAAWTFDRGLPYPPEEGSSPRYGSHWCLAHYILDGHHKTYAAAAEKRSIRVLSMIAAGAGVSTTAELERALAAL